MTVDIGNIHVRMFDGQIQTLTNMHHVPDLKKKLLLLGALGAQGSKFSDTDGGINYEVVHDDS